MKSVQFEQSHLATPLFNKDAQLIQNTLIRLSSDEIAQLMKISDKLAKDTRQVIRNWKPAGVLSPAVLTFRGDIYSGLQAHEWNGEARDYATAHLWILSGLYGILRPFDGILPYRLEMGYPLQIEGQALYKYWGKVLSKTIENENLFINLTADEYLRAIKKSLHHATIIRPKFLTISPKTGQPTFVTVHAKIARGAFANWLITHGIEDASRLCEFNALGYRYDKTLSTNLVPVFVCQEFGGIGLSTRLS